MYRLVLLMRVKRGSEGQILESTFGKRAFALFYEDAARPRWYIEKIDGTLTDYMRDLLLSYSKNPAEKLDQHLYAIVSASR
jgi:hypothetical protein